MIATKEVERTEGKCQGAGSGVRQPAGRCPYQPASRPDSKRASLLGLVHSGLQVAQEANHAAHALQQAIQAAPAGSQPRLRARCARCQLGHPADRVAVHRQHHPQQRLNKLKVAVGGCLLLQELQQQRQILQVLLRGALQYLRVQRGGNEAGAGQEDKRG